MGKHDSTAGEDVRFGNQHFSLEDIAAKTGASSFAARWLKAGMSQTQATILGNVEANVQGAIGVSKLLAADVHARAVGQDCDGTFETMDEDSAVDVHIALQQLLAFTQELCDSLRESEIAGLAK
jgi:hypothetical protein